MGSFPTGERTIAYRRGRWEHVRRGNEGRGKKVLDGHGSCSGGGPGSPRSGSFLCGHGPIDPASRGPRPFRFALEKRDPRRNAPGRPRRSSSLVSPNEGRLLASLPPFRAYGVEDKVSTTCVRRSHHFDSDRRTHHTLRSRAALQAQHEPLELVRVEIGVLAKPRQE